MSDVFAPLLADPKLFVAATGILGLLVGSFLNVVIHRLPRMMERDWHAQAAELRGEEPPAGERFNLATPRARVEQAVERTPSVQNRSLMPSGAPGRCGRFVACQPWWAPGVWVDVAVITAMACAKSDLAHGEAASSGWAAAGS